MPKVKIYTKFLCPYCTRAKSLLKQKGAAFEEVDITMCGRKREEMIGKSRGQKTVPQIFIGDTHVGGSDDLAALDATGELDALLSATGATAH